MKAHSQWGVMSEKSRRDMHQIDWGSFWFREVIFLTLPLFIAVFSLPKGATLSLQEGAVLLGILLGLTVFNAIWAMIR